jgi:hypothetical protein
MAVPPSLLAALAEPASADALIALDARGELTRLIPELEAGRGFAQPALHFYTVLDHSFAAVRAMDAVLGDGAEAAELRGVLAWIDIDESLSRTIEGLPMRSLLRLAALLHDVAKPETATLIEGQLRFPRHGPRGAELMRERLLALGFGPAATDFLARMIRQHLRSGELIRNWPPTDHAIRRFVHDVDGHVLPLMLVNLCDGWATRGPNYTRDNFRRHCGLVNYVVARAWAATTPGEPPLVTGEELMETLDLEGGRLLGAVLTSVRDAQLRGQVRDKGEALTLARALLASLRAEAARTA